MTEGNEGIVAMIVLRALRLVWDNPRLLAYKVRARAARSLGFTRNTIGSIRFPFPEDGGRMVEQMRTYSYENELLVCMGKWLRPGDVFVDVGANIGFVSAYALSLIGPRGQVHAFEPVPKYYANLVRIRELNPSVPLHHHQMGASDAAGEVEIALSSDGNIGWNTMVPGFMPAGTEAGKLQVPVRPLDEVLAEVAVRMVKIDVEGYEYKVLAGMSRLVARCRPVVVLEYAPAGNARLGVGGDDFTRWAETHDYAIRELDTGRATQFGDAGGTRNILLLPNHPTTVARPK